MRALFAMLCQIYGQLPFSPRLLFQCASCNKTGNTLTFNDNKKHTRNANKLHRTRETTSTQSEAATTKTHTQKEKGLEGVYAATSDKQEKIGLFDQTDQESAAAREVNCAARSEF